MSRSDRLAYLLRRHQDLKAIDTLFARFDDLRVVVDDPDLGDFTEIEAFIRNTYRIDFPPNREIDRPHIDRLFPNWLESILAESEIDSNPIYLKIFVFDTAGWIVVNYHQNLPALLTSMTQQLSYKDMAIVDRELTKVLVISEREHSIDAYWQSF